MNGYTANDASVSSTLRDNMTGNVRVYAKKVFAKLNTAKPNNRRILSTSLVARLIKSPGVLTVK